MDISPSDLQNTILVPKIILNFHRYGSKILLLVISILKYAPKKCIWIQHLPKTATKQYIIIQPNYTKHISYDLCIQACN